MNEVRKLDAAGRVAGPEPWTRGTVTEGESGRRGRQLPLEMLIFNF